MYVCVSESEWKSVCVCVCVRERESECVRVCRGGTQYNLWGGPNVVPYLSVIPRNVFQCKVWEIWQTLKRDWTGRNSLPHQFLSDFKYGESYLKTVWSEIYQYCPINHLECYFIKFGGPRMIFILWPLQNSKKVPTLFWSFLLIIIKRYHKLMGYVGYVKVMKYKKHIGLT